MYLLIEVQDDSYYARHTASGEWWADDSVEVYLDADNSFSTQYTSDDHQLWVRTAGNPSMGIRLGQASLVPGINRAVSETEPVRIVEMSLSTDFLEREKLMPGDELGLDIHAIDIDTGDEVRRHKIAWSSTSPQGAINDTAWQNPQMFGLITLAGSWSEEEQAFMTLMDAEEDDEGSFHSPLIGKILRQGSNWIRSDGLGYANILKAGPTDAWIWSPHISAYCWLYAPWYPHLYYWTPDAESWAYIWYHAEAGIYFYDYSTDAWRQLL